jgi:hypothetical protein
MVPPLGDANGVVKKIHIFGELIARESAQLQDRSIRSLLLLSFP